MKLKGELNPWVRQRKPLRILLKYYKKGMYQKLQRLMPRLIFNYFPGKCRIIYQVLCDKTFQIKVDKMPNLSNPPEYIPDQQQTIIQKETLLAEIENSKREEFDKIRSECDLLLNNTKNIIKKI
ncbi:MAG: hypothetical protein ACJA2G_003332 [Cognaticolwellia sp.]|jgi:hypothetical protein